MPTSLELKLLTTIHNPWRCSAYQTNVQSVANNSGAVGVAYDTVLFDPNGNFSTGSHNYTCPVDGWYAVTAAVGLDLTGQTQAFSQFLLRLNQNGSIVKVSPTFGWASLGLQTPATTQVSGLLHCVANDTISCNVRQTNANSAAINSAVGANTTYIDIYWVGPT